MINHSNVNKIYCIIGFTAIFIAVFFFDDMYQKITVIFSVVLVFIAIQQTFAANSSAEAARSSANLASDAQKQVTYIHLANLWYKIKLKGLENSEFINPKFSSLYRQKEVHDKYQEYHVYAWLCWGHAEDCFEKKFQGDPGFEPSIRNHKELHYAWLSVRENSDMFSKDFINWANNDIKSPLVEVKNKVALQGEGVFAAQEFLEKEFIGFFDGKEVDNRTSMSLQFGPDFHIEPSGSTPFRYLNHSCDANAFFKGRNLYAFKKIFKNQEITIDYNCREFKLAAPFACNCKTGACLREIKGYKFLSTYEREIRSEMVPDWLKKMDETENAALSS